jgi:Fe2+ or Zn2+ uptake regulation protein
MGEGYVCRQGGTGETVTIRERIVRLLEDHPEGLSKNGIVKELEVDRGLVYRQLNALQLAGRVDVVMFNHPTGSGPTARCTLVRPEEEPDLGAR